MSVEIKSTISCLIVFNLEFFLGIVNNASRTSKILTAENFKNQHVVTKGR